jgi:hypothetical protein
MENKIVLRSVYGKVNQKYYIQPCPNPRTGKLPDCVKTVDSNGDMILSEDDKTNMSAGRIHLVPADHVFTIVDGTGFDLNDIIDAAQWAAIEHCNWIAKDRYERDAQGQLIIDGGAKRYGVADLYVERPGEITKVKVSKKMLIHKACDYVYEETHQQRVKKCKVLGRSLQNAMEADVTDYLIDIAERNPQKVIDLYEGEDWKMHLFILDAIDRGVIRTSDGIYKYNDKMLGGSIEATITFLRDIRFRKLLDSIKRETYPNLLDKQSIQELEETITDGIPHYDEEPVVTEPLTPAQKAAKTRAKNKS